jgi:hypothetical protein
MNEESYELKAVLQELAQEEQRSLSVHATPEELIAYHAGNLSRENDERLQSHLVWCRECLDLLLDWMKFTQPEERQPQISDAQVAAAWQAMRQQLYAVDTPKVLPTLWGQRLARAFAPTGILQVAMAAMMLVSLGLSAWVVSLYQQNDRLAEEQAQREQAMAHQSEDYQRQITELRQRLSQPQLNIPIEDLRPQETIRGQGSTPTVKTITVSAGVSFFPVILNVSAPPSYPEYTLEILDQSGNRIWHGGGLQPQTRFGVFTVALPCQILPAGQYQIRISGRRAGQEHPVESYMLRIQYQ